MAIAGVSKPSTSPRKPAALGLPVDVVLLVVVGALLAFGLMMVYSSTFDWSYQRYGDANTIFFQQLKWMGLGLGLMLAAARLNYQRWRVLAVPLMLLTGLGLIWVLFWGALTFGAQRSVFNGSVQPSELAKFALVIYLAVWLASKGEKIREMGYGLIPFGIIVGGLAGFILLQPDISAAATIVLVAITMFFIAGADVFQMGVVGSFGALAAFLVLQISETGRKRLADYLAGVQDITQASWQIKQAAIAFINGGFFGLGLGQSRQKFGFLPTPHTDSIFAIIGEELGLLGCLLVIGLFVVLVWRGFRIAAQARDSFGAVLAAGITFWIALEALINIAVMVGAIPVAGNALPFISYGGSNLVVTLTAMGVLLSVSRRQADDSLPRRTRAWGFLNKYLPSTKTRPDATFDFSRRDRRGRISRSGRR